MPPAAWDEDEITRTTGALLQLPGRVLLDMSLQLVVEVCKPLEQAHRLSHLAAILRRVHSRWGAAWRQQQPALSPTHDSVPGTGLVRIQVPLGATPAVSDQEPSEIGAPSAQEVEKIATTEKFGHLVVLQQGRRTLTEVFVEDEEWHIIHVTAGVSVEILQWHVTCPCCKWHGPAAFQEHLLGPAHSRPMLHTAFQHHGTALLFKPSDELVRGELGRRHPHQRVRAQPCVLELGRRIEEAPVQHVAVDSPTKPWSPARPPPAAHNEGLPPRRSSPAQATLRRLP
mmetsp:Transcript_8862/g.20524  ORF Transcript_8862/g.20524 Transcript_8862/m.20524 type:complete len:284 (+) Transcript_8862:435-1286(+)